MTSVNCARKASVKSLEHVDLLVTALATDLLKETYSSIAIYSTCPCLAFLFFFARLA